MPKINIYEIDRSASNYLGSDTIVYVPVSAAVPTLATHRVDSNNCILYESKTAYETISGSNTDNYVLTLLSSRLKVLCHYLGADKTIHDFNEQALNFLRDRDAYDIKFLTSGRHTTLPVLDPITIAPEDLYTKSDLGDNRFEYTLSATKGGDLDEGIHTYDTLIATTVTGLITSDDVSSYYTHSGENYVRASGYARAGVDYYNLSAEQVEVTPDVTDVSPYYTYNSGTQTYIKASGTAIKDTQYYDLTITAASPTIGTSVRGKFTKSVSGATKYTQVNDNAVATPGIVYYTVEVTSESIYNTSGYTLNTNTYNALNNIASERGDCATIASFDATLFASLESIKNLLDTGSTLLKDNSEVRLADGAELNAESKRGAIFVSYIKDSSIHSHADLAYLQNYAQALLDKNQWEAIAGISRGKVDEFTADSKISKYELDNSVQTRNGYSFNGVVELRPSGATLWGDRTTYRNSSSDDLVASSFLSIRNIISDVAKVSYNQAIRYTFETNNEVTWANFKNAIVTLLDQMMQAQVIADYQIIKQKADRRAQIKCQIHISPYGPVEDFDIGIILTDAGLNVNLI